MKQAFSTGSTGQPKKQPTRIRRLLAMDFDNTISTTNTYAYFRARWSLLGREEPELQKLVDLPSFHPYYNFLFKRLVEVMNTSIEKIIEDMAAAQAMNPGMRDLLSMALATDDVDVVILSDSNNILLTAVLEKWQLELSKLTLLTNRAELVPVDGLTDMRTMRVTEHDAQDPQKCRWCRISICKGRALTNYMQRDPDVGYEQVLVVGDSAGDLCMAAHCVSRRNFVAAPRNSELARMLTAVDRSERRTGPSTNNSIRAPLEHQLIYTNAASLLRPLLEDQPPENGEDVQSVLCLKQAVLQAEKGSAMKPTMEGQGTNA